MNRSKKIIAVLLALIIAIGLGGCSIGNLHFYIAGTSGIGNVFKIGSMTCSKKEFRVYLANYKNLYGSFEGVNLWETDGESNLEQGVKSAVLDHLTRVYSLNLYAKDNDISLSTEEEKLCEKAAEEYYNSLSSKDKSYMGASKGNIEDYYRHYALAEKVYFKLMNSVDDEVSEDEARMMDCMVMCVKDKNTADTVLSQLSQGVSFETLAGTYTVLDSVNKTVGRHTFPEEVDEVIFKLDNGQTSSAIKTDEGYYIVYCINKYNKELSESNKANVIAQRKTELIENLLKEQEEKYYSHLSTSTLKNMKIETSDKMSTDSFFEVLNKYIKFS